MATLVSNWWPRSVKNMCNMQYDYDKTDVDLLLKLRAQEEAFDPRNIIIMPSVDINDHIAEALQKEKDQSRHARTLLIPINLSTFRWAGLIISLNGDNRATRIGYIDPSVGNSISENFVPEELYAPLKAVYGDRIYVEPQIFLQQTDKFSYGLMVVENLILAARESNKREVATNAVIRMTRICHILRSSQSRSNFINKQKIFNDRSIRCFWNISWIAQRMDLFVNSSSAIKLLSLFQSSVKPHIIILGKSGAGKGTLSTILKHQFGYEPISVGDLNRNENQRGTPRGLRIRELVAQNKIVSNEMTEVTFELLNEQITQIFRNKKRFILDNFPFCQLQVPYMFRLIEQHHLEDDIILIVPDITDEETMLRLENRQVCSSALCNRSFNRITFPPIEAGRCDSCHSALKTRIDDTPEIIRKKRIPFYRENILPAIRSLSVKVDSYAIRNIFDLFEIHFGFQLQIND